MLELDGIAATLAGAGIGLRRTGLVEDLAALDDAAALALPAAYVFPAEDTAADAASGSALFQQLVTSLFGVAVVVGSRRPSGAALPGLREIEMGIIQCLAGSQPAGLDRPISFADARLVGLDGGRITRLLRFRATWRIRVITPA